MNRPRLTLAHAMGIVLVIGVFLGWMRSIEALSLTVVVAPVVLIFVWLLVIARERPSPFLWGFTVFGWAYYASIFMLLNEIHAKANGDSPRSWLPPGCLTASTMTFILVATAEALDGVTMAR